MTRRLRFVIQLYSFCFTRSGADHSRPNQSPGKLRRDRVRHACVQSSDQLNFHYNTM